MSATVILAGCASTQVNQTSAIRAAHYSAPDAIDRAGWISFGAKMMYRGTMFVVGLALTVRPDGTVLDCHISRSSGDREFDALTCASLKERARFVPAKSPQGSPMYGVFRTWNYIGDLPAATRVAYDVQLPAGGLSSRIRLPARVDIMFAVDTNGRPSSCSDEHNDDDPLLVEMACRRFASAMATPPARNEAGKAVPSVQDVTVMFIPSATR